MSTRVVTDRGWHWARRHLFAGPLDAALTVTVSLLALAVLGWALNWLVVDAYWAGSTPADCPDKRAACWPFVRAHLDQFVYGTYPGEARWRVELGLGLMLAIALPLAWPNWRHKFAWLPCVFVVHVAVAVLVLRGGWLGLPAVDTTQWGGFFLTLVTTGFVLMIAFPVGVLLALGRTSRLPLVVALCAAWVEFWRSVPALAVLFVAIIMLPLFLPSGLEIDKLARAFVALAVLMSAYLAEAVRGALASLPPGQGDAAAALGLGYWRRTWFVILPQALPVALPQITSNAIGLFKETTVLLIVGLFDLLGMVVVGAVDPAWSGVGASATGYAFAGMVYWCLCFGISRYSASMERKYTAYRHTVTV